MTKPFPTPLERTLPNLSLHSLLMVTAKALARAGFGDVEFMDRRSPKEKSREGGHELLCRSSLGGIETMVIVKVVRDSVRVRHLDELYGTVVRTGADTGLLVATKSFTSRAKGLVRVYGHPRLTVFDGPAFARFLARHGIGVRPSGEPDYAFLEALEQYSEGVRDFVRNAKA